MAQIRKYQSGGTFTYDGTDYSYDDIKDSLTNLAKSSDQRVGLQFNAILKALKDGNNLSYNSTTNTLEGDIEWVGLNERQKSRLERGRSAVGSTLGNLFNGKEEQVRDAVSLLRSWAPPVKPIELVDISEDLEISDAKNANYNRAQQRLQWAMENLDKDINWNQESKKRGTSIQSYSKEAIQELLDKFDDSSWTPEQKTQLADFGIRFVEPNEKIETETTGTNPVTVRTDQQPPVNPPTIGTDEKPLSDPTTGEGVEKLLQLFGLSQDGLTDEQKQVLAQLGYQVEESSDETEDKLSTDAPVPGTLFKYIKDPSIGSDFYHIEEKGKGWWVTPRFQIVDKYMDDAIFIPKAIYPGFRSLPPWDLKTALVNVYQDVRRHRRGVVDLYKLWVKRQGLSKDNWKSYVFRKNDAPVIERYFDQDSGEFKWRYITDVPKMKEGGTVGSNDNGIKFNIKPDAVLGILDLANSLWTTAKTADRQRAAIKENVSLLPPRVDLSAPQFNDQGITAAYNQRIKDILKPRYNQSSDPLINYSFQHLQNQEADKLRGERDLALSNLYSQHQDKLQELAQKQRVIDNQLALQNLKMVQQANQALANVDVSERLTKGQSLQRLIYEMRTKGANDAKRAEQYGTYVAQQNADATYIEKLRTAFDRFRDEFNENLDKYGGDWQQYMETEHPEIAAKLRSESNVAAFEELYKSGVGRQSWFNWPLPDFTLKQKPDTKIETETIKVKRGGKMRSTGDQLMLDSDKATRKAIQKLDEYTYKIILKMLS